MDTNKLLVAKFYDSLNLKGNEQLVKQVLAANWIVHPALQGEGTDVDKYLNAVKPVFKALPDFKITVHEIIAEDSFVAVRGEVTATHAGNLFGVAATNKSISYMTQDFHRIENGKIAESWHLEDWLSVLFQIGAIKF